MKEFAKQIFENFYHLTDDTKKEYGTERNHTAVLNEGVLSSAQRPVRHGPLHVSRVAYYIPVLTNYLVSKGDAEARELSQEEVTAMQVAGLLHDSGRKSDLTGDAPYTKSEIRSVSNCMYFMKANDIIGLEKAFQICHAASSMEHGGPEIYKKVIKSADSLDVLRADDFDFNPHKMRIYHESSLKERQELNRIIDEIKQRMVEQGDSPKDFKSLSKSGKIIKGSFDTEKRDALQQGDIYTNIENSMNQSHVLGSLYNQGKLLPVRKSEQVKFSSYAEMVAAKAQSQGLHNL
ncbi:MAG: SidE phosphodiesterase domain-containing protein [Rickettsiales bacterium]|nr:SidE phosphodiesterase domain-containing protein [Pseudomonadota bacterium]MDA0966025.1 SidE phosphodiesterase domain-containing protein [Pseudomonadota bacterium]MDG4542504.1 SidE phosphodiesterase domain-containing protein [Rickettsiales bacterium]MDG4545008.1 SidE phosphodiesterase domain-containing protein [Rickettsiales bacterium]MDG4547131.1 SidE phosphodiesterase domain-containing protein [Rickettsiales bacterium]